jgi:hypothetical protein
MIIKISNAVKKYAKGWIILILLALYILFNLAIMPVAQAKLEAFSGGTGPIDLKFFYTPEKVYSMLASYGEEGRTIYRNFELFVDIIYPIIYSLFFSLLIAWLFNRGFASKSKLQNLNVIPFTVWFFDLLENICIVTMISLFPSKIIVIAWLATLFTMFKWCLFGVSIVLVLTGITTAVINSFKKG